MNSSDKALSLEQARNLLPYEFRPNAELTGRKKLLNTSMGLIAYHYSLIASLPHLLLAFNGQTLV